MMRKLGVILLMAFVGIQCVANVVRLNGLLFEIFKIEMMI